jgi:hypothetical protein
MRLAIRPALMACVLILAVRPFAALAMPAAAVAPACNAQPDPASKSGAVW